jgi:YidC/Oxa1 family membrane protein insertase
LSLDWLYTAISFVLKMWHSLFVRIGLDPDAGITWTLSIFFLVVTVRILLFRFFIKQVKSQRAMQELQPDIAKLRAQYGTDRQGMAKAQQELFKERGVNPLSGCLPILLQAPVFLALFHVLRRLRPDAQGLYTWDDPLTTSAAQASLFGAPISSSFNMDPLKEAAILSLGVTYTSIRIVAFTLMILMSITTFITQKQIMRKGGPVEGQAAMIQKFMLYVIPVSLFVSGFFFPIGVLLYWFMNNLWTMGQQFYILHKHPPKARVDLAKSDRPATDPKLLAPKPGAKPSQPKGRRPPPGASGNGSSATSGAASGNAPPTPPPVSINKAKASSAAATAGNPGGATGGTRKPAPGKRPASTKPKRKKR